MRSEPNDLTLSSSSASSSSPASRVCRTRPSERGLTLLEVLAAFLIFSLVFTVLVGTSQKAVQKQGLSLRRLEAKELADAAMVDLDTAFGRRELPFIEEEERQQEEYTIRVLETQLAPEDPGAAPAVPDIGAMMSGGGDIASLIAMQNPALAPFVRQYDIEVEWTEGATQQTIQRTTFAFDWPGAAEQFAKLLPDGVTPPGAAPDAADSGASSDASKDEASSDEGSGRDRSDRTSESETEIMERWLRENAPGQGQ